VRALAALAWKDAVQHAWLVPAFGLVLPLGWLLFLLSALGQPATVTLLEAHLWATRILLPLVALILGNRLVVAEYHGRTQQFLEALPIHRAQLVLVKWALGGAVVLTAAALSLGAGALAASFREPIDPGFLGRIGARTALFSLAAWSFFFVMGFLGRVRFAGYLAIAAGLGLLARTTDLELLRFGPFAMVAGDLVLERDLWPWEAMAQTAVAAAVLLGTALVLSGVRDGGLAETLAKPMAQREKAAIGIAIVALLIAWAKLAPPDARAPYDFPEEDVARSARVPLEVYYGRPELRADAEAVLARLEEELPQLGRALGWSEIPAVHVMISERLDTGGTEPVAVGDDDGLALRANFVRGPGWDEDAFVGEVVGRVLDEHTDGRSYWEPYGWLRDGIAEWWPTRDGELPRGVVLRALFATRARGVDGDRLRRWDLFREREGFAPTEALAATGVAALVEAGGRDSVLSLARDVFGPVPPDDSRPVIGAWWRPMPARERAHLGMDRGALCRRWNDWLAQRRALVPAALAALARAEASLSTEQSAEGLLDLVARVRSPVPLPEGSTVSLLHLRMGPFDHDVWPWEPSFEDRLWPAGAREMEVRVRGHYGRGTRVWAAIDVEPPEPPGLGTLRLAYARLEAR